MFGSPTRGANAYAKVGLETGVTAASPHKLILMLYEGALAAIASAKQSMLAGDIAQKGQSISKAILIIDSGLRTSLDKNAGGEIAKNLDALYEYMSYQLLQANLKNQPEILDEVCALLKDLKEAWEAIGESAQSASHPSSESHALPMNDPLMPHSSTTLASA